MSEPNVVPMNCTDLILCMADIMRSINKYAATRPAEPFDTRLPDPHPASPAPRRPRPPPAPSRRPKKEEGARFRRRLPEGRSAELTRNAVDAV